jgi:predicted O-linked N-acetylglucosamine transferase (SPINDLY family)
MAHYRLMAMYKLADVVLDSVYFGGDTTTREAFEVGAPIVTLPGKALGQRWTQAYYKVMGITKLIAKDTNDYIRIAIATANASDAEKQALRASIKNAVFKKLYRNTKAAKLWADTILSVAYTPKRVQWRSPGDEKYEATRHDEL